MTIPKTVSDVLAESLARIARHVQPANEVRRRESRVRHRALLAQAQRRGVPARGPIWEAVRRAELPDTQAIVQLEQALADDRALVVLAGRAGCGKSVAMARRVLHHPGPALLVHAAALAESVLRPVDLERQERAARAVDVGLLAVDDLGLEATPEAAAALAGLLCQRMDVGGVTVLSTNLAREVFCARYFDGPDGRVASRFAAAGTWCTLAPVDYRRHPEKLGRRVGSR